MERAEDVRVNEIARAADGTVHVRLGRQVQDVSDGVLLYDVEDGWLVAEIDPFEDVFGVTSDRFDVGHVPGISEAVEVDELGDLGAIDDMLDDIGPDETGAAGD